MKKKIQEGLAMGIGMAAGKWAFDEFGKPIVDATASAVSSAVKTIFNGAKEAFNKDEKKKTTGRKAA